MSGSNASVSKNNAEVSGSSAAVFDDGAVLSVSEVAAIGNVREVAKTGHFS